MDFLSLPGDKVPRISCIAPALIQIAFTERILFMHASLPGLLSTLHPVIQLGCLVLFLFFLLVWIRLFLSTKKVKREIAAMIDTLSGGEELSSSRAGGLAEEEWDELRVRAESLPERAKGWWRSISGAVELYPGITGRESYFLVEPASEVLPYETVVGRSLPLGWYRSVPGLLTGAGLTLTFVAILVALHGVHYDKANTVEPISGIDSLINGLSGKFLSSIVALLLSILFTVSEHLWLGGVKGSYAALLAAVERRVPRLSGSRILLDIRRSSDDASVEVKHISAEVVERFAEVFNQQVVPNLSRGMAEVVASTLHAQMSPTLEKMTGSLEGLQGAIVGLESQKQESLTGEFERILTNLESSMTRALGEMASGFHDALTGSARQEFGNMQGTLEGTRSMLGAMNDQFATMQAAFNGVVSRAEETTMRQINAGREQTEALGGVMQGLMGEMKSNAEQSMSVIQVQLGAVVEHLVGRVSELSAEMMSVAHSTAADSRQSSERLLQQTEGSSQALTARLEQLLDSIRDRSADFDKASKQLRESQEFIGDVLNRNGEALSQMAAAGREVREYTNNLRLQGSSLAAVADGQQALVDKLDQATSKVQGALDRQEQTLQGYESKIQEFEKIVMGLDGSIARIMKATSDGLSDYNQRVRTNFDTIVDAANKLLPEAAKSMQGQIEQFAENLEDFSQRLIAATQPNEERVNGRAQ